MYIWIDPKYVHTVCVLLNSAFESSTTESIDKMLSSLAAVLYNCLNVLFEESLS